MHTKCDSRAMPRNHIHIIGYKLTVNPSGKRISNYCVRLLLVHPQQVAPELEDTATSPTGDQKRHPKLSAPVETRAAQRANKTSFQPARECDAPAEGPRKAATPPVPPATATSLTSGVTQNQPAESNRQDATKPQPAVPARALQAERSQASSQLQKSAPEHPQAVSKMQRREARLLGLDCDSKKSSEKVRVAFRLGTCPPTTLYPWQQPFISFGTLTSSQHL